MRTIFDFLLIAVLIAVMFLLGRALGQREVQQEYGQRVDELQREVQHIEGELIDRQQLLDEIRLLRLENQELHDRMEQWLDHFELQTFEATAYSPYDDRNGINSEGDPGVTALGYAPGPGKFAVDFNVIEPHSLMWVEGEGWGIAADTGGAIKGRRVDVFRRDYGRAMRYGRQTVKVGVRKR